MREDAGRDGLAVTVLRLSRCFAEPAPLMAAYRLHRGIDARAPALLRAFEQRRWPLPQRIDRVYDAQLACRQLGWQPRHGFDEVLRQLDAGAPEVLPFAG